MRLHRRQQRIEVPRRQSRRPPPARRPPASLEPRIDPRIERLAFRRQKQRAERVPAAAAAAARRDASRRASARWPRHFQRTGNAGAVARLQAFGGSRIAPRKFGMQRLDAVAFEPRPHGSRGSRPGIGGTADSPRVSALKYRPEPPTKIGTALLAPALPRARSRHPRPRRRRRNSPRHRHGHRAGAALRASSSGDGRAVMHAEVAIDLHGIGIDDEAAGSPAQASASADLPLAVGPAISTALSIVCRLANSCPSSPR